MKKLKPNIIFKGKDFAYNVGNPKEEISALKLAQKLKTIFEKQGYIINWNELEKQSLNQTLNTLSMASPFSKEEKQMLLEAKDLEFRKKKFEQIIKLYSSDNFSNKTIQ